MCGSLFHGLDYLQRRFLPICVIVLSCATIAVVAETCFASDLGLTVPQGFEVTQFATDELAHDIFSMTLDARGRVVVSGPGYVKTLIDDDCDGQADRAVRFSSRPVSGAQGLLFLGNNLLYTGDGGLWLLRDNNGDGVADGDPERWLKLNNAEHGAHAIILGPDGWVHVMCGNKSGMIADKVTDPASPVTDPVAGCIVRIRDDGTHVGIVADGFRNPYDLGFNAAGHLFTVDSDGERSHHLPWYAPTRMFDVSLGQQHGWVLPGWQRSWSRPEEFFDNVPRVCEFGRGSPTGLVVYQHHAFSPHYQGGVFTACWTLGRVYYVKLTPDGASYTAQPEVFLETAGDVGFAPVDLAVGPLGELFVAVGGRGTQGGVFRVRCTTGNRQPTTSGHETPITATDGVLNADQPLSSWSLAQWMPLARELGAQKLIDIASGINSPGDPWASSQRIRAIEILVQLEPRRVIDLLQSIKVSDNPEIVARLAWAISRSSAGINAVEREMSQEFLAALTHVNDLFVQRSAWEALSLMSDVPEKILNQLAWGTAFDSSSRQVRRAAIRVAGRSPQAIAIVTKQFNALPPESRTGRMRSTLLWTHLKGAASGNAETPDAEIRGCLALIDQCDRPDVRIETVRLIERWLGDIRAFVENDLLSSGYALAQLDAVSPTVRRAIADSLVSIFPSGEDGLDREVARVLAMIDVARPAVLEAISQKWTPESSPVDDVHYLTVFSRIGGERNAHVTSRTAFALTGLHKKLAARHWYPSREWPLWIAAVFVDLMKQDSALPAAVVSDPSFGRADHALFALRMPKALQETAARRLFDHLDSSDDEDQLSVWTATLIEALSVLPDEILFPRLRNVWDAEILRDAIVEVLARSASSDDRHRFVVAIQRSQPSVVETAIDALMKLPATASAEDLAIAVGRLRRSCLDVGKPPVLDNKKAMAKYRHGIAKQQPMRRRIDGLLRYWSGLDFEVSENHERDLLARYEPWFQWFRETYPEFDGRIHGPIATTKPWRERLAAVRWSTGDISRGQTVYRRKACHQCHDGNARLGPELAPAVRRFSRADLFAAVINPSENISPQYQGVQVVTRAGRVYQGLPVYDSPDGLLLRTAPETTVRLTGDEIELRQASPQSFMPEGLLDNLGDEDLADLYAYLRSLR